MLKGVICEDRALVSPEPVEWEECLECAASWQNPCNIPYPVLKAVYEDAQRPHSFPSVSSLTGCIRKSWLMHTTDYYEYPSGRLALLVGTKMHEALELASEEAGAEPEIKVKWTTEDGLPVHGTADLYVRVNGHGILQDWKTAKAIYLRKLPYGHHEIQVNLYAFMLERNELEPQRQVDLLKMVYLSKTGPDTKTGEHNGIVQFPVEKWEPERAEKFITTRALAIQRALDGERIPPKTNKRWECGFCPVVEACKRL